MNTKKREKDLSISLKNHGKGLMVDEESEEWKKMRPAGRFGDNLIIRLQTSFATSHFNQYNGVGIMEKERKKAANVTLIKIAWLPSLHLEVSSLSMWMNTNMMEQKDEE